MHLGVVLQRWANRDCRQRRQRTEIEDVRLVEGDLLLGHHLIQRLIDRPAIAPANRAGHGQQAGASAVPVSRCSEGGDGQGGTTKGGGKEITFLHVSS